MRTVIGLLVAVCTILLGPAARAQDDWNKVVDAARKEGKVVLYTANVGVRFHHDIAAAFEKRYGIRVEVLEARASEIRERIRTEQAAGRALGDVSHNGATTTALQLKEGVFQPHGTLPAQSRLRPGLKTDGIRSPVFAITYGILVNTRQVPAGSEPKSWNDLLDPKWQGKIISDDMRALGGGSILFFATHDAFGRQYHEKLATQQPIFTRDLRDAERRVARGEASIWIPFTFSNLPLLKGLPVKAIVPEEGATYVGYEIAILKNAPNPNAARLLMNFFLEREAQTIYANGGYMPVTTGVSASVPESIRPLIEAKLLGTADPARQDAMLKAAREIYK